MNYKFSIEAMGFVEFLMKNLTDFLLHLKFQKNTQASASNIISA